MTQTQQTTTPKRIAQEVMYSAISNACENAIEAMNYGHTVPKKQQEAVYRQMRAIARRMTKYTCYEPNHFMSEVPNV